MYRPKTKFGVVLFDDVDNPEGGWISYGDKETTKKITGTNELSRDTLWWSNLVATTLSRVEGSAWIRSESFIGPKMKNIINEWGIGLPKGQFSEEINQKIVVFLASLFNRVMTVATNLAYETRKELGKDTRNELDWFQKNMLRADFASLLPKAELPKDEMMSLVKRDQAYVDYTKTSSRYEKSHIHFSTQIPRGTHALRMLETQIPVGEFSFIRGEKFSEDHIERIRRLVDSDMPFLAEITIKNFHNSNDEGVFGFGNSMDKKLNTRRSWVTSPEFIGLTNIADIEVNSLYFAKKAVLYEELLPKTMLDFVKNRIVTSFSWTGGVIAENIWKAGIVKPDNLFFNSKISKGKERPTASIREAWLKSEDKIRTSEPAFHLSNQGGYSVSGYGSGSIRVSCLSEHINDFIIDAVQPPNKEAASLPVIVNIPKNFGFDMKPKWCGENADSVYATFALNKQLATIRQFDDIPLKEPEKMGSYAKKVKEFGIENMKKEKIKYEQSL